MKMAVLTVLIALFLFSSVSFAGEWGGWYGHERPGYAWYGHRPYGYYDRYACRPFRYRPFWRRYQYYGDRDDWRGARNWHWDRHGWYRHESDD